LRELAEAVGLAPATVSLVINRAPAANSIPKRTKDRIFAAAAKLHYRPNYLARSLRSRRTFTVGVLVPEVSEGYAAAVMSGIEDSLLLRGYFYFVASHRHRGDLIEEYPQLLMKRAVEGLIVVDTPYQDTLPVPVVAVSGHREVKGVTNIELNHQRAAELALELLVRLGHRNIAFIKGQAFSSDTEVRWKAITTAARRLGLHLHQNLIAQLEGDVTSPELGRTVTQKLLALGERFSALFAFNDISAIGATRALQEAGLLVPRDVSVVGFDDIQSAAFQNPALTTIRQPLRRMGEIAAETVLRRIGAPGDGRYLRRVTVEPELIVRGSTAAAPATAGRT
jgi:DNA-binding LacI/PurR family transcriptional regulator